MKIKEIEQDKQYENTSITVNINDMKGAPKELLKEAMVHGPAWYEIAIKNREQYHRLVEHLGDKTYTIHDNDNMYDVEGDFATKVN